MRTKISVDRLFQPRKSSDRIILNNLVYICHYEHKKNIQKKEKLSILQEASENGVNVTLEKHGIYPATYYSWRKKFNEMGEVGLDHGMTKEHLKRIRELEKENSQLKEIVAEKELEGRLKDELLKKKWALEKGKKQ